MIVAVTGTPGTGKTSVSRELEEEFNVVDLTEFIKEKDIGEKKKEIEVGAEELVEALEEEIDSEEDILLDGHLSHHYPADFCVVLRTRPDVLRERLNERSYSDEKIEENVESEILDVILSEVVQKQENIIEIDTTEREAEGVAEEIRNRIEEEDTGYGEIDWTSFITSQ